ncbi:male-specific lethal 3 homolog [Portunus trituberculatus]|uniref:male-specific lethal 3 homolog n=1 Tax=Portunus trituberculatus TaxID=210409 RepID=UPI001E1CED62|nr:male-specific lethal 3 homolog [Portunus trituberculatus]
MVSTRGVRVKFSEGERVLCYEPDPTKAKVLYDSKVLEVVFNKDGKGRKQIEYLIHFQGWNASWDRCVSEDFVLKDTDENRDLQKQLADKAQIKLSMKSNRVLIGGPLYKERKRKRRLSETIRETIERERQEREQQEESETSSQTGTTVTEEDERGWPLSEGGSTTGGEDEEDEDEGEAASEDDRHFPLVIPDNLRAVLERDYHLINDKNKLLDLPTEKTVLSLLENYVRFFAMRYLARTREKRRTEIKEKDKCFMTLDLCKEVMDGLRVCFDFHIETLLLYAPERRQAERLRTAQPVYSKQEVDGDGAVVVEDRESVESLCGDKDDLENEMMRAKAELSQKEEEKAKESGGRRMLRSKRPLSGDSCSNTDREKGVSLACESGRSTPTTVTSVGSTAGVSSLGRSTLPYANLQHNHLQDWTLLPDPYRHPPPPVLLYGHIHLLRLFVKLPEILYRMNLSESKKKAISKHLDLFLEYISTHSEELFLESHYINNMDV